MKWERKFLGITNNFSDRELENLSPTRDEESLRMAIKVDPSSKEALKDLALLLANDDRFYEAVHYLQKAIILDKNYKDGINALALIYSANEAYAQAIKAYKRLVVLSSDNTQARVNLAIVLGLTGQKEQAFQEIPLMKIGLSIRMRLRQGFLKFMNGITKIMMSLNETDDFRHLQGLAEDEMANLKKAEMFFRRALELNPRRANTCNNLGALLADQGNFQEAIDLYQRALEIDPEYVPAMLNLALAAEWQHNFSEAITYWNKVSDFAGSDVSKRLKKRIQDLDLASKEGWLLFE